MENKVFDKTEQFIADRLKANSAAVDETTASVEAAKANKEKAEKQAEKALSNGNVDEYQKAQKAIEKADATIYVHSNLLNKLKEEPIISRAEYESMVSDVLAELNKTVTEDRKKVIALIDQIAEIAQKEKETVDYGNVLLKKLQHDLYRDQDCTTVDRNGYKRHDSYKEKRFKDLEVRYLADAILQDQRYKKFGGKHGLTSDAYGLISTATVFGAR